VQPRQEDPEKLWRTAELLPEKVEPLPIALGEMSLDYEYLLELQEEIESRRDEAHGKSEDHKIMEVVLDALTYLDQRSAFWSQQDGTGAADTEGEASLPASGKSSVRRSAASPDAKMARQSPTSPEKKKKAARTAHYDISQIQSYETKSRRSPEPGSRRPSAAIDE
jgi:hypothetical protein